MCSVLMARSFILQRAAIFLRLDGFVPGAALGVEKPEQFLERLGVGAVADERLFALGGDQLVVLQLLEVMRQRRAGDAGLGLDFADDHAVGVGGEQQADDPQARLGAERGEHVGVAGDCGVGDFHNYISTILEM